MFFNILKIIFIYSILFLIILHIYIIIFNTHLKKYVKIILKNQPSLIIIFKKYSQK